MGIMLINRAGFIILIIFFLSLLSVTVISRTYRVERGTDIQATVDYASDGDTIIIGPRTFYAKNHPFVDSLCGNCKKHKTAVSADYGFIIKGKALHLIGVDREKTVLMTGAGYGIYFVNSRGSSIANLTVSGGRRNPDGNATDGAIVVRNSSVRIHDMNIVDNDNRVDTLVIGIGGIIGREGAELIVERCNIINNSWDGVALYRGAQAVVSDCLMKDGRGAGIGVTRDATCTAYRNRITGYWKGIGAFGNSWVVAHNNAVYDNLGWGIIATDNAFMDIANNVIHNNGNCGVAPWSTECRGRIINNIITNNGWREEVICPCVGVVNYGDWAKWEFAYNIVWNNKDGNYRDIWDQTGINGNLSVDPRFLDDSLFILSDDSPAVRVGHPDLSNRDGTRSHIGMTGGPQGFIE
jgi:hypothetical protein